MLGLLAFTLAKVSLAHECGQYPSYAPNARRPWVALVRNLADPALDCSGAVIGGKYVLSSASCFCAGAYGDKDSLRHSRDEKGRLDCKGDGK